MISFIQNKRENLSKAKMDRPKGPTSTAYSEMQIEVNSDFNKVQNVKKLDNFDF